MFRINRDTQLTTKMIESYIQHHQSTAARYEKLHRYYRGESDILQRVMTAGKPNNRIVNPYPRYITLLYCGYLFGSPIAYSALDEAQDYLQIIKGINDYNDSAAHDASIGRDMSIYGIGIELLYSDEQGDIRFARLDPKETVLIYDDTITGNLAYAIRYYDSLDNILSDMPTRYVQVFSSSEVITYRGIDGSLIEISRVPHFFDDVPVSVYLNNDECLGDWESCIPLIDAADVLASDSVNEVQYMADAYLVLSGFGDIGVSEDNPSGTVAQQMKDNRLIMLPDASGSAQWVVKNLNDSYIENIKQRVDQAIHKFSLCPSMTDQEFASNTSGVAMKYKLLGFENASSVKERAFKKGLQRRIELITNVLNLNNSYNYMDVQFTFNRNLPVNLQEMAQMVSGLRQILSQETSIRLTGLVDDPLAELEKYQAEQSASFELMKPDLLGEEDAPTE